MTETCGVTTELWARGYAAVPCPREVELSGGDLVLASGWSVVLGQSLPFI